MKDRQPIVTSMLFTTILLMLLVMCTGCTTPPVIPKFPEAPTKAGAMETCPDLKKLDEGAKLSDVAKKLDKTAIVKTKTEIKRTPVK